MQRCSYYRGCACGATLASSTPMAVSQASRTICSLPPPGTIVGSSVPVKQALWSQVLNSNLLVASNKSKLPGKQGASKKQRLRVYAEYNDRKAGGAGDFVAGFVIGGVVFGALGYLFAPQVNKLLSVVERELDASSKKLPVGLDDDEGLAKTRRSLNEKIAQLNAAIDDVSAQLKADDKGGGQAERTAEIETAA